VCFFVSVRENAYTLSRKFLNTLSLQICHSVLVNATDTFQLAAATGTLSRGTMRRRPPHSLLLWTPAQHSLSEVHVVDIECEYRSYYLDFFLVLL